MFYTWTGRVDSNKSKRIHQVVRNENIEKLNKVNKRCFGIVGFESDEGVRRNKGRVGAAKAPNKIRSFLSSLSYNTNKKNIIDVGNVTCKDNNLEKAQGNLGKKVTKLLNLNYTPLILGGGHETLYGHYMGVKNALEKDKKIGIINLDAHFDLRSDKIPSSGTMFRQILEKDKNTSYLCLGIQELSNTQELFQVAKELNVEYVSAVNLFPIEETFRKIETFAKSKDFVIYTICSDVINQAYAPGVSAPAPFGLNPDIVRSITQNVIKQPNFISIDISEVNPTYDLADQTSRLASYIIGEVLTNLNKKDEEKQMY